MPYVQFHTNQRHDDEIKQITSIQSSSGTFRSEVPRSQLKPLSPPPELALPLGVDRRGAGSAAGFEAKPGPGPGVVPGIVIAAAKLEDVVDPSSMLAAFGGGTAKRE